MMVIMGPPVVHGTSLQPTARRSSSCSSLSTTATESDQAKMSVLILGKMPKKCEVDIWEAISRPLNVSFFKIAPASFSFLFGLFQKISKQFYNKLKGKNVHPVYITGILTYDLQNVSLLP